MAKMTGSQYLDILCGSSTVEGLMKKSSQDAVYRRTMLGWLNLVLKDISNRQTSWHWKFLEKTATFPTVANQHTYDLPTDIDDQKMIAIYDRTNDTTYDYVPYDKFVSNVPDPSNQTGQVRWWTVYAKTIRLYPVPSAVVTTYGDYVKVMTYLADDSNTCDIPEKYEPVIIDGALIYAYRFEPKMGNWGEQHQAFEAGMQRMINENRTTIAEKSVSGSHRAGLRIDGPHSDIYPLDGY